MIAARAADLLDQPLKWYQFSDLRVVLADGFLDREGRRYQRASVTLAK
jgi:hypothetical protein